MNRLSISLIVAPVLAFSGWAIAQTMPGDAGGPAVSTTTPASPDNTRSNKDDPSNTSQTADAQPNNAADMEVTQRIRRSVNADKNLSTYGHNVKIVTTNGRVTLNGVVRSDNEKAEIGAKAASVVGNDHVANELKVATN
jgi:hyperosmotically inducible periplasmic protein